MNRRYSQDGTGKPEPAAVFGIPCSMIALGAIALLVLVALFSIFVSVNEGELCAVTTFGKMTGEAGPGLHARWPFGITAYRCFSTREVVYETSDDPNAALSDADYKDFAVPGQTSDGQQISVKYSIRYHVDPEHVEDVYSEVAQSMREVNERVIKFHSRSIVRLEMQKYEALDLYSGDIFEVQDGIELAVRDAAAKEYTVVDAFVLRKIDFDPDYILAVEQKQIAFEGIQTADYRAQQAKQDARAAVEKAKGDAESKVIAAQADATAIELKGVALRNNPLVIQYEFVQHLTNIQWGIMPFDGATPFINIPGVTGQ